MDLNRTRLLLVPALAILLLAGCGEDAQPFAKDRLTRVFLPAANIELDAAREKELLTLANNRDAWFLASDITAEALEGLYGSWSVICRYEHSLADYKGAVEGVRPCGPIPKN